MKRKKSDKPELAKIQKQMEFDFDDDVYEIEKEIIRIRAVVKDQANILDAFDPLCRHVNRTWDRPKFKEPAKVLRLKRVGGE